MRAPTDTAEKRAKRAQHLRWAREIVEPSRYRFARKLGADPATIKNIEAGKTNPGIELLAQICHALRIDLEYIVNGDLRGCDPDLARILREEHPEAFLQPFALAWLRNADKGRHHQNPDHSTDATVPGALDAGG